MSTEVIPANGREISNEDKVKIKLHLLFMQLSVEIHLMGSRFQRGNVVNFMALVDSYQQCETIDKMVLNIRECVEAMVFSEDLVDIDVPDGALRELPEPYDGYYSEPTRGFKDIVKSLSLVNWYLKSMATHECFREIQNNSWPENKQIKDRSISDPAEFFYGYLQEIDACIAAVKLGIKRAEIRGREREHERNERVIMERKDKQRLMLQDEDFGNFPKANPP